MKMLILLPVLLIGIILVAGAFIYFNQETIKIIEIPAKTLMGVMS